MNQQKSAYDFAPTDFEEVMTTLNIDLDKDLESIDKAWRRK
jgi:hypothetical protein